MDRSIELKDVGSHATNRSRSVSYTHLGGGSNVIEQSLLPSVEDIVSRPLSEVLLQAEKEARSILMENGHSLDVSWEGLANLGEQLAVTDAEGRLSAAIVEILSSIVEACLLYTSRCV